MLQITDTNVNLMFPKHYYKHKNYVRKFVNNLNLETIT